MHFIKYNSYNHSLIIYDEISKKLDKIKLMILKDYHIIFKKPIKCRGYWDGKSWHACPFNKEGVKQCSYCKEHDATRFFAAAYERGFEELFEKYKNYDYSVYLALFGNQLKCGVTRSARLEQRLKEQGARYFVELMKVKGMKEAYSYESYFQNRYNFRNAVYSREKLKIHDDVNLLKKWVDILKKDMGEKLNGSLTIIKNKGIKSYENAKSSYKINGLIVGLRADIVFWQSNNEIFYVPLNKFLGYTVEIKHYF